MPSSADEAFVQEEGEPQRKDSLKAVPSKKKQKKNAKKAAAAAKLLSEQPDESSGIEGSTPPIDLLVPPSFNEDRNLSSSPDAAVSDPEPPCPDTPPIFAQEIHDNDQDKVPALVEPLSGPRETVGDDKSVNRGSGQNGNSPLNNEELPASTFRGFSPVTKLTPPSPSPPTMPSRHKSPPQSPRPVAASPRLSVSRPDSRSMAPHNSRHNSLTDAPPPHLPQRHFSRIPDTAFGLSTNDNEIIPGTDGYFCGFDSLDGASHDLQDSASNLLLIGSQGALDICRYNRNRREVIGRLEGLRGSVVDAKILPIVGGNDPLAQYRPLVACVLYGPTIDETDELESGRHDAERPRGISSYQTTVEVLSLKRSRHLGTLYRTAAQPLEYPLGHPLFSEPKPEGSISITAEGEHIVVSSGESGEVFVFVACESGIVDSDTNFRCIGKFWTRTKEHGFIPQPDSVQNDPRPHEDPPRSVPILGLSRRWLAIAPPMLSSSQKSIDGIATTSVSQPGPPGVAAYVSPPPPILDCEIDGPLGPSLLNRVTKQATNEIRKGAQWVGEQGMGIIKSYWQGPPAINSAQGSSNQRKPTAEDNIPNFPPTHAHGREQPAIKIEPSLVSVIDLDKLADFELRQIKNPLAPMATFNLVDGCSFLSFAPSGLALMTTNHVGDTSTIWDLMRVTDPSAAAKLTMATPQLQHATGMVRKSVSFSRLSPSTVVDVRWTMASNRVGILTSKGTLHLHEIPRHDPLAVALRSPASPAHLPRSDLPSPSTSPHDLSSGWMNNVRSGWQNVSGRLNAIRSASDSGGSLVSSTRQSLNQASVAARYASGRAVRNGYNTALEGAYTLRHSQDNKIRLKSLHHIVRPGCFRWLTGKDEGLISTMADGILCTYTVKSNYHVQGKRTTIVLDASKKAGPAQSLPPVAAARLPPAVLGWIYPDGPHASCSRAGVHGFWTLNRDASSASPPVFAVQTAGNVAQDKETCPQYLPLHRLRQINLFAYDEKDSRTMHKVLGTSDSTEAWCFGEELIPVDKVNVEASRSTITQEVDERAFEGVIGHMEEDFNLDDGLMHAPSHQRSGTYSRAGEDLM
ncbi:hypothetical protein K461DRAFT_290933 [Myriangium duriaei CBS 260.36]|uniref:BCAS3 domain-containing protein n=1 Tax=Myriangium duriaei CBS 260.36 TaxID=1168546 RepID=A0A9P4J5V3_9PEZI|nr:hypothetical protein K461DRAFT_290933 [Myriangium duriaei CBS 260.36]